MSSSTMTRRFSIWTLAATSALALSTIFVSPSSASVDVVYREGDISFGNVSSPTPGYNVQDTELRSSIPDASFEVNARWNVGTYGPVEREAVAYSLLAAPAGMTLTGVKLDVWGNGGIDPTKVVELHSITNAAFTNENTATWNSAATGVPWTTAGGDFSATVLSQITYNNNAANTPYTFASTPDFVAAVNSALAGDGLFRFLAKATDETTYGYKSFWASDEGGQIHPTLTLTFDFVPEPASLGLLGLGAVGILARRRKAK